VLPLAYVGLWLGLGTLEGLGFLEYSQLAGLVPFFEPLRKLTDVWPWLGEALARYTDWLHSLTN